MYDPKVGRWLSEDPIGFTAGDSNVNRYVSNAPVWFTDPSGLDHDDTVSLEDYAQMIFFRSTREGHRLTFEGMDEEAIAEFIHAAWEAHVARDRATHFRALYDSYGWLENQFYLGLRTLSDLFRGCRNLADERNDAELAAEAAEQSYDAALERLRQSIPKGGFVRGSWSNAGELGRAEAARGSNPRHIQFLLDRGGTEFGGLQATGDEGLFIMGASLIRRLAVLAARQVAVDVYVGTGHARGFGQLIGWGRGGADAAARARTITMSELKCAKITRPVARYWLNFYRDAVARGAGGDTAPARVKLMERVLHLLDSEPVVYVR